MWAQIPLVAAGLWLMAAPAVLDHDGAAATSDRTVGPIMAAVAFLAVFAISRGMRWLNLPVGLWLVVAPWLLDFPTAATVSSLVCGVAALVLAPMGAPDPDRYGGGWMALVRTDRLAAPGQEVHFSPRGVNRGRR